mmetsp:Transcript_24025/g.77127  ORF Transcript_24025/g.77127 Transcript_24025/m.77127 type:complete len:228 (-) Transcript_24025:838-1521(-)
MQLKEQRAAAEFDRPEAQAAEAAAEAAAEEEEAPREELTEWSVQQKPLGDEEQDEAVAEEVTSRRPADKDGTTRSEALLDELERLGLLRPGELVDALLERLPRLVGRGGGGSGATKAALFTFVTGVGACGDQLAVRSGGGTHAPLRDDEAIAATRSLLRSGRPSLVINDANFLDSQFGVAARRRLGCAAGGLLLALVAEEASGAGGERDSACLWPLGARTSPSCTTR